MDWLAGAVGRLANMGQQAAAVWPYCLAWLSSGLLLLLLVASKRTLAGKKVMYLASSRVGSLHKKRVRVVNQASMLLPNST